jgi:hypothetical protein
MVSIHFIQTSPYFIYIKNDIYQRNTFDEKQIKCDRLEKEKKELEIQLENKDINLRNSQDNLKNTQVLPFNF